MQKKTLSALAILLIWLISFALAGVGVIIASQNVDTVNTRTIGEGLYLGLQLAGIDLIIVLLSIGVATVVSGAAAVTITRDPWLALRQLGIVYLNLVGTSLGLYAWISVSDIPKPSIFFPMTITVLIQVLLYVFSSIYIFASNDLVRKKVWTPVSCIIMIILPYVILYSFSR